MKDEPLVDQQIERATSNVALANRSAINPQVDSMGADQSQADGMGAGQPEEYQSPGMYDPGATGGRPDGILLISRDGATETFISIAEILEDYDGEDNWSVELPIVSLGWTGLVAYSATGGEYDLVGSSQTKSFIPIYRSGVFVANYGVYKEGLAVTDGDLYVEFYHK